MAATVAWSLKFRAGLTGLSVVAFDGFAEPGVLKVRYLDCVDGTSLLDIKPYVPEFDIRTQTRSGWYETRSKK